MRSRIDDLTLQKLREDWAGTVDPVTTLARRYGVSRSTIDRRAAAEKWPPRGSAIDDPVSIATILYRDLTHELRQSLQSLRVQEKDPAAPQDPATHRAALIRNHRRALFALMEARRAMASTGKSTMAGTGQGDHDAVPPPLDLAAARHEILDRIARIEANLPPHLRTSSTADAL